MDTETAYKKILEIYVESWKRVKADAERKKERLQELVDEDKR